MRQAGRVLDQRVHRARLTAGVAPSTVLERVAVPVVAWIIESCHAEIRPEAMGLGLQAMISLQPARHSRQEVARIETHVIFSLLRNTDMSMYDAGTEDGEA